MVQVIYLLLMILKLLGIKKYNQLKNEKEMLPSHFCLILNKLFIRKYNISNYGKNSSK